MWRKRYERSTCDVSYRYRLVSIRQRVTMTMALAWKTNDLHTASLRRPPWPRIAEAYRENEPSPRMNNAWANAVSVSKLLSKIGLSFSLSLSPSEDLVWWSSLETRDAWKGGGGVTKGKGKGRGGRGYQCRRGEIGRKMGNPATWWQMVDQRWGEAWLPTGVLELGRERGRNDLLSGVNIPRSLRTRKFFLRNFYKFILRACVLFASHSLKSKCLFSFSFFSRKVYFLFLKKFYIKLIFVILVCKIFIFNN